MTIGEAQGLLDADDATVQHLLHLLSLLPSHSRVLLMVRKLYRLSLCLDGVLEHRGLPNIIVVLARNIPILLKQLRQLMLLYQGQVTGYKPIH